VENKNKPLRVSKKAFDKTLAALLLSEPRKRSDIVITKRKPAKIIPPKS
jgi:hypothetical protein